jgi:hypothetical protein
MLLINVIILSLMMVLDTFNCADKIGCHGKILHLLEENLIYHQLPILVDLEGLDQRGIKDNEKISCTIVAQYAL